MTKTFYLLFISLALSLQQGHAQEAQLGLMFGFGQNSIRDTGPYYDFGLAYEYSPQGAFFSGSAEMQFALRTSSDRNLHYLRLPVGFDFLLFKNRLVRIKLGPGLYGALLMSQSESPQASTFETVSPFIIGFYLRSGLSVKVSERYRVELLLKLYSDITGAIYVRRYSPGGLPYSDPIQGIDGIIRLGFKYNLY